MDLMVAVSLVYQYNVTGIDCNLLIDNLTLKFMSGQNGREIPSLPEISFGICVIFVILYHRNLFLVLIISLPFIATFWSIILY